MAKSIVTTRNRRQVVDLPEAVAFPNGVRKVDIIKIGAARLIVPQGQRWDDWFENGPRASEDFASDHGACEGNNVRDTPAARLDR
ncbi:conserved hypothetical protein [Rhodopseudomonas palustris HaA2]|uniref:Antitoxin n=1 Tax=Rhodopseudomonas palustris (strain HaA2) TaxID=316058 RepID=Q2IWS5_RHOP2|nr:hypothetical protein [Rhodopseudomonas palustris]ABD07335.1 conserved hypothetical protein [Rhodopseudomonas palustris HaA2]